MTDEVHNPAHYTQGNIECLDAIKEALGTEQFIGFCKGNALKYIWRSDWKKDPALDTAKAIFYLTRLAEVLENECD